MTDVGSGSEQFSDEDRVYAGSRFRDVVDALFANPYQKVWGRAGEPPLPNEDVTIRSVFGGLLSLGKPPRFERASERTLDSGADLRWGPDRKGFARLLHPNGVCLVGRWQITEDTPYSGYFARGSTALVVARYSSGAGGNRRGQIRSLALVGKLFPTTDPDHADAAANRELHHAGGHRRRANRVDQRRRAAERAGRDRLPPRSRRDAADQGRGRVPAGGQAADHPSALSDCGAGKAGGRADARAGVHAAARRARAAGDSRRGPRRPRRGHGPHLRSRRSGAEADAHVHHRGHRRGERRRARRSGCAARSGTGGGSARWCSTTPSSRTTATPSFTSRIRPGGRIATIRRPPRGATERRSSGWCVCWLRGSQPTIRTHFQIPTALHAARGLRGGSADARRSRALRTVAPEIELDTIAFAEVVDALTEDGAGVEEHFLAARVSNKAESLVCTESLDCSCHSLVHSCIRLRACRAVVAPQTEEAAAGDLVKLCW